MASRKSRLGLREGSPAQLAKLPMFAAFLLMSACASTSYMGIPVHGGSAPSELQQLTVLAQSGDKQAQLALGIRFEEGVGVPADRERAIRLYRLAASDSGGTMWVYSPPVGRGDKGRVIPIEHGPRRAGLSAAKAKIKSLEGPNEKDN